MAIYENELWGYQLEVPDTWVHRTIQGAEGFAAHPDALDPDYDGSQAGHLLIQAEWNGLQAPIERLWKNHIGKLAGMMGAKQVGSAPWTMAGATGVETDIALPKKTENRLWAGVLVKNFLVLKFMLVHPIEERQQIEPIATNLLKSLSFPGHVQGLQRTQEGLPIPQGCTDMDPRQALSDLEDSQNWKAYETDHPLGGVQAFYYRESPAAGWTIDEFLPFPGNHDLPFARLRLRKENVLVGLGLIPSPAQPGEQQPKARIAYTARKQA